MSVISKKRIIDWSATFLFGMTVWAFFAVFYRHHLHYQEQLQLFLFTPAYLMETINRPGGLAIYLGRFFTQFFYESFLGASVLTLLLVLLQRFVQDATDFVSRKPVYRPLTFIPSLGYALMLCNEDVLLSGLIAALFSMLCIALYNRTGNSVAGFIFIIIMIPVLYWLAGFSVCVFLICCLLNVWTQKKGKNNISRLFVTVTAILVWVGCPYIAKEMIPFYPVRRFWFAGDYYRFVVQLPVILPLYFTGIALLPFVSLLVQDINSRTGRILMMSAQAGLLSAMALWGIIRVADWEKEEIMAYSYYARTQKWNSIIALADKKSPDGPLTVSTLNLALSRKNYLPEYMFTYFQHGAEGLLPDSGGDYNLLTMVGEVYYHLGLINTAQQYAFEAMETIPDFQKSVRCIKRLAETHMINGEYALAAKYLEMLKHTLFYRKWASEASAYSGNEERMNVHPEWSMLRKLKPKEDFLFSDREKDMMLGLLYQYNPANTMAYEYLLACMLLEKELPRFAGYLQMDGQAFQHHARWRSYQEAMALIWSQSGNNPSLRPPFLREDVAGKLDAYRTVYMTNPAAEAILKQHYGDTYWYYFHYGRKQDNYGYK